MKDIQKKYFIKDAAIDSIDKDVFNYKDIAENINKFDKTIKYLQDIRDDLTGSKNQLRIYF